MNVEMMLRVADAIESENAGGVRLKFDMETWGIGTACGTAACVAGTVNLLLDVDAGRFNDHRVWMKGNSGAAGDGPHRDRGLAPGPRSRGVRQSRWNGRRLSL